MRDGRSSPSGARRTSPTWVKILVGLHLFAITVWALPRPLPPVMEGKVQPAVTGWLLLWNARYLKELDPVKAYLFGTGTWQYWDMFAPEPAATDWYGSADVTYRDGTTRSVEYPRMFSLPIAMRYVKERYRKFYERAHDDKVPLVWPTFAQAMALRAYTDRRNPPVVVSLRRHWLDIADPGMPQKTNYQSYVYYSYAVDEGWLQRVTGGS